MSRYIGPKARICRREGMNLFERPKYEKILERRGTRPGMHGDAPKKTTEYSSQLREKQRLRFMFGLTDGKLERYVEKALKKKGLTTDNLMKQLELRLDNAAYRAGFAISRLQSRQMSSHGHFLVNGRRVNIPSFELKAGDKVELRPKLKSSKLYASVFEENKSYKPMRWLKVDVKIPGFEVLAEPTAEDFEKLIDTAKILEFYSR